MNKDTNKNLKTGVTDNMISIKDTDFSLSYTKTHKLITALYMVTDILEKDEPIRNKLRALGAEILSDMHILPTNSLIKISQVMSFLDITSAMNIISEMNSNILRKEFIDLHKAILESNNQINPFTKKINLSEFFIDELDSSSDQNFRSETSLKNESKGHAFPTRIGVQKGSTLMKALSDKTQGYSGVGSSVSDRNMSQTKVNDFNILKNKRRQDIIYTIKSINGGATITDIKNHAKGSLVSCGEKTLQRELVSMLKDNVLYKTGEKRWSKYFIK